MPYRWVSRYDQETYIFVTETIDFLCGQVYRTPARVGKCRASVMVKDLLMN